MNKQQQFEHFENVIEKCKKIMLSKGDDYAGQDRLSNFKDVGQVCGTSGKVACLHLIATKVARLSQLFTGKIPNNESIEDSILDLINYSILLDMLVADAKPAIAV
jgi:hypothetical protein